MTIFYNMHTKNLYDKMRQLSEEKPSSASIKSVLLREKSNPWENEKLWNGYTVAKSMRDKFKEPIASIFRSIANKYDLPNSRILEIGSGLLENNQSYLSSRIPHKDWTFSDLIVRKDSENPKYYSFNLLKKPPSLIGLFEMVIGCNVIDTIPYDKHSDIFSKISSVLKPNGFFIHYADIQLLTNTFYNALNDNYSNFVLLPGREVSTKIYKITRKQFNDALESHQKSLSDEEKKFFSIWGKQTTLYQALTLFKVDKTGSQEDRTSLLQRIEKIFSPSLEIIDSRELFGSSVQVAAKKNQLDVVRCGMESKTTFFETKNDPLFNFTSINMGFQTIYRCYVLAPGISALEASVHTIVLQKLNN